MYYWKSNLDYKYLILYTNYFLTFVLSFNIFLQAKRTFLLIFYINKVHRHYPVTIIYSWNITSVVKAFLLTI